MTFLDRLRSRWRRHDEQLADEALREQPQTDPLEGYERQVGVDHAPYRESDEVERRRTAADE